jgi:transposase
MSRSHSDTEVKALIAEAIAPLLARIAELEAENARLKKNSSNSSKPPSSDIVKPPKPPLPHGRKRKIGGQHGHAKHEREPFSPEQIDRTIDYELAKPGKLIPLDTWHVVQQVELIEHPFLVTAHRAREYRDPATGQILIAPFPPEVRGAGLLGPRLSAFVAYLKGGCRMSYGLIATMFEDVLGLEVSTGQLAKVVQKSSLALAPAYQQLLAALPTQEYLGIDETGHTDRGDLLWTWCFRAVEFVVFRILDSRATKVLHETLGKDYAGLIGCDYFGVYRKFLREGRCRMQFCQAHLIRDVKFLTTLPDRCTKRWAHKLLKAIGQLFHVIHRKAALSAEQSGRALRRARDQILRIARRPPATADAQTLADRFRHHGPQYFTFLEHAGVEPTNNRTEQTIRFVVQDRKATQGTRGLPGQTWCQRIWSILGTCRIQGRSAFGFLVQTLQNHFQRIPTPHLLPAEP